MEEVSIIQRRTIEAIFAKAVFAELQTTLGAHEAAKLLGRVATSLALQAGASHAAASSKEEPDLLELADLMPLWEKDDALKIIYLERSPQRLSFNVERCRYAEMYKELGMQDLGHQLSCKRDGEFCRGFNPKIHFERTQTIMQGASHCDFRYTLEDGKEAGG